MTPIEVTLRAALAAAEERIKELERRQCSWQTDPDAGEPKHTIPYDACHAKDQETIRKLTHENARLRRQLDRMGAQHGTAGPRQGTR